MNAPGESAGHPAAPGEDPQQAVARARAAVLGGRGPGAPAAETDRYKRERPTLGPLPAPLERELVHLRTAAIRDRDGEVDASDLDVQRRRVRQVWAGRPGPPPGTAARPAAPGPRQGAGRRGARWPWLLVATVFGSRRRRRQATTAGGGTPDR